MRVFRGGKHRRGPGACGEGGKSVRSKHLGVDMSYQEPAIMFALGYRVGEPSRARTCRPMEQVVRRARSTPPSGREAGVVAGARPLTRRLPGRAARVLPKG